MYEVNGGMGLFGVGAFACASGDLLKSETGDLLKSETFAEAEGVTRSMSSSSAFLTPTPGVPLRGSCFRGEVRERSTPSTPGVRVGERAAEAAVGVENASPVCGSRGFPVGAARGRRWCDSRGANTTPAGRSGEIWTLTAPLLPPFVLLLLPDDRFEGRCCWFSDVGLALASLAACRSSVVVVVAGGDDASVVVVEVRGSAPEGSLDFFDEDLDDGSGPCRCRIGTPAEFMFAYGCSTGPARDAGWPPRGVECTFRSRGRLPPPFGIIAVVDANASKLAYAPVEDMVLERPSGGEPSAVRSLRLNAGFTRPTRSDSSARRRHSWMYTYCSSVCTISGRWWRISSTSSKMLTVGGRVCSSCSRRSTAMNVPVRPTPALHEQR